MKREKQPAMVSYFFGPVEKSWRIYKNILELESG